ncbi:uncharacterized protein LOC107372307 [Tetranychus urticae]|uniref:Exonuclease domain-containing protein n=1 Tax=Tetranychus urticae TaxID=32264 RepID=T1JYH7_TETUR|nr:uncharacterized protein LOC107372307 [Tetranychus urticae]
MIKSGLRLIHHSQGHRKLIGSLLVNNIPSFCLLPSSLIGSPISFSSKTCSTAKMDMPDETKLHYYETHPDIVWADCEMSGLDINKDYLLEIAIIITDSDLNELATLGPLVIKTDPHILSNMDDWCTRNHTKTGLYKACLESQLTIEQADQQLHDLLMSRNMKLAVLAGNSIAYDKLFLSKYCPKFSSLLHYRTIDVSSFKEVIKRWYPDEVNLKKRHLHRALDDIRDCITELRYYRSKFFKPSLTSDNKKDSISGWGDWSRIMEPNK